MPRSLHVLAVGLLVLAAPAWAAKPGAVATRAAATTVLTEHPSSLRSLKRQVARTIRPALRKLEAGTLAPGQVLEVLQRPFIAGEKQVREFGRLSLGARPPVATAKMIDFEGKPMAPEAVPRYLERYVSAIERAGLEPGIERDRLLFIRLPGPAETGPRDRVLREALFDAIAETNLSRVVGDRGLPFERLILPQVTSVSQLMDVHAAYERAASAALDRRVARGRLSPARRDEVFARLRRIQVVPLVESAPAVLGADRLVRDYLDAYRKRLGADPSHFVLFIAGSDLNREIGPVAGQLSRQILQSRMARVIDENPAVDFIEWVGIGSGPMRSGVGRYPEMVKALHPGMTFTVQPDQVDQPNLNETLAAMSEAASGTPPRRLGAQAEHRLLALGAAFAEVHAKLSLESSLATVRLNNLLGVVQQRGRKATGSKLVYEKDGQLFLRSARPRDEADGAAYGRSLDVMGYAESVDPAYAAERRALGRAQAAIDRRWPKGLSDPRAIGGAFARYLEGHALSTVAGLGHALRLAESRLGRREVEQLRPFITFLVANDGFVLTRDRRLVTRRFQVLGEGKTPRQIAAQVDWYFADLRALERFLGQPLERVIRTADRARYEKASRRLYQTDAFLRYMKGEDISLRDWERVMDAILPLLENPSWNRLG